MVAKSYQGLKQAGEPFEENKRMYVFVITKSGTQKKVRWYSDKEYAKMYPGEPTQSSFDERQAFGFGEKGFIWVFPAAGDHTDGTMLDFNRETKQCQYATHIGWFSKREEVLAVPFNRIPVILSWENYQEHKEELRKFILGLE